MKIELHNYEPFLIEYLEGNLSGEQTQELLDLVALHPNLQEEMAAFESVRFVPDEAMVMEGMEQLIKTKPGQPFLSIKPYVWILSSILIGALLLLAFIDREAPAADNDSLQAPATNTLFASLDYRPNKAIPTFASPIQPTAAETVHNTELPMMLPSGKHTVVTQGQSSTLSTNIEPSPKTATTVSSPAATSTTINTTPVALQAPATPVSPGPEMQNASARSHTRPAQTSPKARHKTDPSKLTGSNKQSHLSPMQQMIVMEKIYQEPPAFDQFYRQLQKSNDRFKDLKKRHLRKFLKSNKLYQLLPEPPSAGPIIKFKVKGKSFPSSKKKTKTKRWKGPKKRVKKHGDSPVRKGKAKTNSP